MDGKEWTGRKADKHKQIEKDKKDNGNMWRVGLGKGKTNINHRGSLGVSWEGPYWRGLQQIPRTPSGGGMITRRLLSIANEYSNHSEVRGRRSR